MVSVVLNPNKFSNTTTAELKTMILSLVQGRDTDPLNQKVQFFKNDLDPYVEELIQRNPFPVVEEQVSVVLGAWTPVWSTIPFHDSLPGRLHDQSYQIFRDNGYYANMARYAPGHEFLQKFSSFLAAYDFMVMQSFAVHNGQWFIQNVGIEQALRKRDVPLDLEKAEAWFTTVLERKLKEGFQETDPAKALKLEKLDRNTIKKFEKTYLATPQFEHLYVDHDFRLVKTQRDERQRPSYTIAIRRDNV